MFNLEQAIQEWRRRMADCGIRAVEALDELEYHLRQDLEQRLGATADARQAFESAVQRLGGPKTLGQEFAKATAASWRRRFIQGICFISATAIFSINVCALILCHLTPIETFVGLGVVSLVTLYLASLPFLPGWLSGRACARFLGAVKIASLFLPLLLMWALLTATQIIPVRVGLMANMVIGLLGVAVAITTFAWGYLYTHGRDGGPNGPRPPLGPRPQVIPPLRPGPPDIDLLSPPAKGFSPMARQTLEHARAEAARLGHDFIGTEHVLLGMLQLAQGVVAKVMQKNNLSCDDVRREIARWIYTRPALASTAALPLTPRAQKALHVAGSEAALGQNPWINEEHILVGLLVEGSGVAARALRKLGIHLDRVREEISTACARP